MTALNPNVVEFELSEEGVRQAEIFFASKESSFARVLVLHDVGSELIRVGGYLGDILTTWANQSSPIETIRYTQSVGLHSNALAAFSQLLYLAVSDFEQRSVALDIENIDQQQLLLAYEVEPKFAKHIRSIKLQVPTRLKFACWPVTILRDLMAKASNLKRLSISAERTLLPEENEMIHQIRKKIEDVVISTTPEEIAALTRKLDKMVLNDVD